MTKTKIFFAIAGLAAGILFSPSFAFCADTDANVEVNLKALDDIKDYRPPPMFDSKSRPLTGYDNTGHEVKKFPLKVESHENSINPGYGATTRLAPAAPVSIVRPPASENGLLPLPPLESVEKLAVYSAAPKLSSPPTPKRKPSFTEAAVASPASRSSALPVPRKRPAKFHASESFIRETIAARTELTPDTLTQPSAQDVLAAIGGEETTQLPEPEKTQPLSALPSKPIDVEYSAQEIISLPFLPNDAEMNGETLKTLNNKALPFLEQNPELRVQIQAFAGESAEGGQSSARRLSLSRAITVRGHLIEGNIDPKRIDIRALGEKESGSPVDRVDLVFIDQNQSL